MKELFVHRLAVSFIYKLDHQLCNVGSGYVNQNVSFYKDNSSRLTGLSVYSSPFKPFVADASVQNAIVPSGISGAGFIPRGTSGLAIDWMNGRVIFSGAANNLTNLSGRFAIPDFDIFYTTDPEEKLLFDTKWVMSNPTVPQTLSGLAENEKTFPAIYVRYYPINNKPFQLGGTEESQGFFRCIVIADDGFKFDAVNQLIGDMSHSYFPILVPHEEPFGFLGDIKSGIQYNYATLSSNKVGRDLIYIDEVNVSPLNYKLSEQISTKARISLADVHVRPVRDIRTSHT